MTDPQPDHQSSRDDRDRAAGIEITIRTGTGTGRTPLSSFDAALLDAGIADFNLITLSSVIPPRSTIRRATGTHPGVHGDRLYCVLSHSVAKKAGETVWAGLGWVVDERDGKGLFVEHHAGSEESLAEQIELTLGDMVRTRGGGYGPVQMATTSTHCDDQPACALVVATYEVRGWGPEGVQPR